MHDSFALRLQGSYFLCWFRFMWGCWVRFAIFAVCVAGLVRFSMNYATDAFQRGNRIGSNRIEYWGCITKSANNLLICVRRRECFLLFLLKNNALLLHKNIEIVSTYPFVQFSYNSQYISMNSFVVSNKIIQTYAVFAERQF